MHQIFGILMAVIGVLMLVCGTMKSEFIVYRLPTHLHPSNPSCQDFP